MAILEIPDTLYAGSPMTKCLKGQEFYSCTLQPLQEAMLPTQAGPTLLSLLACVCALRSLAFSLTINVIVIGGKVVKALTLGGAVLNSTGFIQWMQRRPPPAVKACL